MTRALHSLFRMMSTGSDHTHTRCEQEMIACAVGLHRCVARAYPAPLAHRSLG